MKKKLCIVLADYYDNITDLLVEGASKKIKQAESKNIIKKVTGSSQHKIFFHVPGVFEIPVTISKLINKYDAFVALGCVIKGKTPHFDLISTAVVNELMSLSVKNKKPIGNGIITCLNMKQALERADPKKKDIGGDAVLAVLQTLANFK
jgi:6,7-dimethyl-8-ribityllumazine synthase